jgi:hypothetical protein
VARLCRKQAIAVGHGLQTALADLHFNEKQNSTRGVPMFAKITIAIALILGTASGALAAPKQKQHTSRTYLYDAHGQHGRSVSRAKTAHVKTTHFKTVPKQKHRTSQAYASYESHNWSFGGATSAFAMANSKRSSYRYEELYNTRAQVSGPASRAAATPKQKHSSNSAYDVYDTRGWYIGSDPDATIRFMMAMDPTYTD